MPCFRSLPAIPMSWALRLPSLAAAEGGSPQGQLALSAGRLAIACSGGVGGEPGGVQVGEGEASAVPHDVVASAQEFEVVDGDRAAVLAVDELVQVGEGGGPGAASSGAVPVPGADGLALCGGDVCTVILPTAQPTLPERNSRVVRTSKSWSSSCEGGAHGDTVPARGRRAARRCRAGQRMAPRWCLADVEAWRRRHRRRHRGRQPARCRAGQPASSRSWTPARRRGRPAGPGPE